MEGWGGGSTHYSDTLKPNIHPTIPKRMYIQCSVNGNKSKQMLFCKGMAIKQQTLLQVQLAKLALDGYFKGIQTVHLPLLDFLYAHIIY